MVQITSHFLTYLFTIINIREPHITLKAGSVRSVMSSAWDFSMDYFLGSRN